MDAMNKKDARMRIEFLRQELQRHNYRYYVLNDPEITDFEYDVMMMELASLEKIHPELASPDSPTVKVGSGSSVSSATAGPCFRWETPII